MKTVLLHQFKDLGKESITPAAGMSSLSSSWNAGLLIDPTEFSRQLANLHMSMRQANAPAPTAPVLHSFARRD